MNPTATLVTTFAKYFHYLNANDSSFLNFPLQRRPTLLLGFLDGLVLATPADQREHVQRVQAEFSLLLDEGFILNEAFYEDILARFQDINPKKSKEMQDLTDAE